MRAIEQIPQLPARTRKPWQHYLTDSLMAVGGALVVTGIIYAFHLYPTIPNISIVYLLVILLLASTRGRYAAILTAVVAFLSFDFFLVPPFYTLTIAHWEDVLALCVFLVTALITSHLATVMRQSVEQAWLREREARILYEAGRVINSTDRLDEQLDSIALSLVRVFSPWGVRACALLVPDENGTLRLQADAPVSVEPFTLSPEAMEAAREVMVQGNVIDISEPTTVTATPGQHELLRLIPLKTAHQILGVLCLRLDQDVSWFTNKSRMQEVQEPPSDQATFFWTFLDQAVLIIERALLRAHLVSNNP
jgi:two-component system sensor histidine kinase KdpD